MRPQPNILFLMADQLSASALPPGGSSFVKAPHLDSLARDGVWFENNYCAAPLCAPSRFSLLTGSLPARIGAWDNSAEFPATVPTVAHYLRNLGYRTSLSGKMHFCGPDQLHGFEERLTTDIYPSDFGWTPDWRHPEVRPNWYHNMLSVLQAGPCIRSNQLDYDDEVTYAARRQLYDLARSSDGRPWFLTVSWTHPHDPYAALPRLMDLYNERDIPLPKTRAADVPLDPHSARLRAVSDMKEGEPSDAQVRRARHAYWANVTYIDEQVGTLLAVLKESGLDGDTVVVFTTDHGDMLGERGLWYKMCWFEDACRVPLIVWGPGLFAPRRVAQSVSGVDLLPTLVEVGLGGRPFTPASPIDGRSLLPHLRGRGGHDEAIGEYCGEGSVSPQLMLRRGRWKYLAAPGDPEQLYDLHQDPLERHNLAATEGAAEALKAFRTQAAGHWSTDLVREQVLLSQDQRRLVHESLTRGAHFSWDFQPVRDAGTAYMRNHLVLDDLEFRTRFPRVEGRFQRLASLLT